MRLKTKCVLGTFNQTFDYDDKIMDCIGLVWVGLLRDNIVYGFGILCCHMVVVGFCWGEKKPPVLSRGCLGLGCLRCYPAT